MPIDLDKVTTVFEKSPPSCPVCHKVLECVTEINAKKPFLPKEGDFTFCISCTALLRFDKVLNLRVPEESEIPENMKLVLARVSATIKKVKRERSS